VSEWGIRLLLWLAAFLLGSIPFGLLVSRLYGVNNLRDQGSGNIGATNVTRVVGFWPAGVLTFLLDAIKGVLLILPIRFHWAFEGLVPESTALFWSIALVSVLGHCFSPWLRFRGGKGVATIFGAVFLLAPWSGLVAAVVFALTYLATRVGAAASMLSLMAALSVYRLFYPYDSSLVLFFAMVLLAIYRHESNLDQLLQSNGSSANESV